MYTGGYQQWRGGLPEQMCNHIATHSVKPEQPEIKSAKSGQLVDSLKMVMTANVQIQLDIAETVVVRVKAARVSQMNNGTHKLHRECRF